MSDIDAWAKAVWERVRLRSLIDDQIREIALALITERDRCLRAAETVKVMDPSRNTPDDLRACIVDAITTGMGSPYFADGPKPIPPDPYSGIPTQ